jgi:hypothetical protein
VSALCFSSTHFSDEIMRIWIHFDITLWKSIASRARVKRVIVWGDLDNCKYSGMLSK